MILQIAFGLIWTTPYPDEKDLFLKFLFSKIQKNPYEILIFLQGKLYHKYFWLYTVIILLILNTEFDLIWTTPYPDEKDLFLKFLFSKIQKIPYEILIFLQGKLYHKYFWLYTVIILLILSAEFDLIWITPGRNEKKTTFKICKHSQFAKFAKFRMKTQFLFPRQAIPNFFLLYTLITLVILHIGFGLIWKTP